MEPIALHCYFQGKFKQNIRSPEDFQAAFYLDD